MLAIGFTAPVLVPKLHIPIQMFFVCPSVCKPANTENLLKNFHENRLTHDWEIKQRKGKAISYSFQPDDDDDDDDDDDNNNNNNNQQTQTAS